MTTDRPEPVSPSDPAAPPSPSPSPRVIDALTSTGGGFRFVVGHDGRLHQVAFGPGAGAIELTVPPAFYPLAIPTYGEDPHRRSALRVTHAAGVVTTRLVYQTHTSAAYPDGSGITTRITLVDAATPLRVVLVARVLDEAEALEQWLEITNHQPAPVTVHTYMSSSPAVAGPDPHLTHLGGGWAAEWSAVTESITLGTKVIESLGSVRPHLQAMPYALVEPAGAATEDAGVSLACAIEWVGNTVLACERAPNGTVRVLAGANPEGAERTLDPGEVLVTPPVLWAWSDAGRGPLSRRLHRHVRTRVVRDGTRLRATVANNWEATFFDFDEAKLAALIDKAATVGAELFLLDDGWFGDAHPRDADDAGLGDWVVDRRKLPGGLAALTAAALDHGIRFGLWVEPEMVNPASRLFTEHPDWVVAEEGRERRLERNQLVLDLCRAEVRRFVVTTIDDVLDANPGISYLKWDANRAVSEPGSATLPTDRQSHWPLDSAAALDSVMAEVAHRHPEVELMLCASGGGRVDLGSLRWFHEAWTSDNTDPVERLRMQWAAGWFLPANVLASHVTRWGERPLPFACAVAMTGRFGLDLDLTACTDEELAVLARATAAYHRVRDLVQQGDLFRLESPLTGHRSAVVYVAHGRDRAVLFGFQLDDSEATEVDLVLAGLDPAATYRMTTLALTTDAASAHFLRGGGGSGGWTSSHDHRYRLATDPASHRNGDRARGRAGGLAPHSAVLGLSARLPRRRSRQLDAVDPGGQQLPGHPGRPGHPQR